MVTQCARCACVGEEGVRVRGCGGAGVRMRSQGECQGLGIWGLERGGGVGVEIWWYRVPGCGFIGGHRINTKSIANCHCCFWGKMADH